LAGAVELFSVSVGIRLGLGDMEVGASARGLAVASATAGGSGSWESTVSGSGWVEQAANTSSPSDSRIAGNRITDGVGV
jgi:hypothetical protein